MKKNSLMKTVLLTVCWTIVVAMVLPVQATTMETPESLVANCKKAIQGISVADAKGLYDSGEWVFVDVRTEKEVKKGTIPNSVHLDRGVLEFQISKVLPQKEAKIVVFCKSGSRATLSNCTMKQLGYANVRMLEGGWEAWLKEGYPIN